jgi:hypothetical protein
MELNQIKLNCIRGRRQCSAEQKSLLSHKGIHHSPDNSEERHQVPCGEGSVETRHVDLAAVGDKNTAGRKLSFGDVALGQVHPERGVWGSARGWPLYG